MEFGYSKEQVLLRDLYKKFAETEVKPLAEELDLSLIHICRA